MNEPVLVLRVGSQMLDIMDVQDGLMEYVTWDAANERWEEDTGDLGKQLAKGLNMLGYRPTDE